MTATLAGTGVAWGDDLGDWTPDPELPETVATLTVTFDPVACTPVPLVAPTVNQATCTAGAVRPPTIELVPAAGVIYSLDPTDLGDGTTTCR